MKRFDKILKTTGLQTALILFAPTILMISATILLPYSIISEPNIFMILGIIYIFPQMLIMNYWPVFVSNKLNNNLDPDLKLNIETLNKRFMFVKYLIGVCVLLTCINTISIQFSFPESISYVLKLISIPISLGQFFIIINMLLSFYKMSQLVMLSTEGKREGTSGMFFLFFFMPFTLGYIQKKIRYAYDLGTNKQ